MSTTYDFSGWATRNDLKCTDGRTIRQNAFAFQDGETVPLVWAHHHNEPENFLGHALLENRPQGVYAYCAFNANDRSQQVKELVRHGDVTSLSIFANQLQQRGGDVLHGVIKEVSVVMAGANPGAKIDYPVIQHEDGSSEPYYDEAIIHMDLGLDYICHDDDDDDEYEEGELDEMPRGSEESVKDVFDTFTDDEKELTYYLIEKATGSDDDDDDTDVEELKEVYEDMPKKKQDVLHYMVQEAIDNADEDDEDDDEDDYDEDDDVEHADDIYGYGFEDGYGDGYNAALAHMDSYYDYEGEDFMKNNVFEGNAYAAYGDDVISHDELASIIADGKTYGSLKESFLRHQEEYGIESIDYLFPEARTMDTPPEFIKRKDDWVSKVMNGVHHTPFTRIKSIFADITEDEARAKGYLKGKLKKEEVFALLKRTTTPTTVYKKQKLDRDDINDITDFDVVAWLKTEMRMMLDEELARAYVFGDGRNAASDDKISETNIRPIATDSDLFAIKYNVTVVANDDDATAKNMIRGAIKARKDYRGSGQPTMFVSEDWLSNMLLLEDTIGHTIYKTEAELATKMRVKEIVAVPDEIIPDGVFAVIVNLNDYNVGVDKGGSINMFDDFDIDYNQQKYLIETRCSGALTKPYSAIVLKTAD